MKLFLTAAAILLTIPAMAQPGRATKIYNENAAADERRLQKLKDEGRTPNAPGRSSGSSVTKEDADAVGEILTGGKATKKAYEQHEAERKAEQAISDREAEARTKAMHAEHDDAVRHNNAIDRQVSDMQAKFVADGVASRPLDGVLAEEVKEGLYMEWLQEKYGNTNQDFLAARVEAKACLKRVDELKEVATYDTLLALAKRSSLFPGSTGRRLLYLKERFPEHIVETEKAVLANLAYFFGAGLPYSTRHGTIAGCYPESFYEITTPEYRGAILARFMELAKKYPAEAREAAGLCRPHLIPFNICAKTMCDNDACRAEMYMGTLHMKITPPGKPDDNLPKYYQFGGNDIRYSDEFSVCFDGARLGEAARWLVVNRLPELQALSKDDWRQIAEEKHMSVRDFVWSFRDPKSDPFEYDLRFYYKQRYKHLKALAKAAELK